MKCYICSSEDIAQRPGSVRDNDQIKIMECKDCGLVFLDSFAHISRHHYENSGMHEDEISIAKWVEESAKDDERRFNFLKNRLPGKSLLDFGCGTGSFLIKARDLCCETVGIEVEKRLENHFRSIQLRVYSDYTCINQKFDYITMFHVMEHLPDPVAILQDLKKLMHDKSRLIIEVPSSEDALLTLYKNEAFSHFTYWSCHLFLFNMITAPALATKAGFKIESVNQVQRYPISNHLYWLSENSPGGHIKWAHLDSEELNKAYEGKLAEQGKCDTILMELSINA